jgi:hypothetical protein
MSRGPTITAYGPHFASFSNSVTTGNFSHNFLLGDHCALTWKANVPTSSSSAAAAAAATSVSSYSIAGDLSLKIYSPSTHFAY